MNQSNSRTNKRQRDSSVAGRSFTGKTGTTGPYGPQFEQLLIDHGVDPKGYEDSNGNATEPENIQAIRERLARSRSSLSPPHFDEAAFKGLQRTNRGVSTEQDVMGDVFPQSEATPAQGSIKRETRRSITWSSSLPASPMRNLMVTMARDRSR